MDIIGKKKWYFIFSLIIIIPGVISLALFGLRLSIDFTGGSLLEFRIQNSEFRNKNEEVGEIIKTIDVEVSSIQLSGENTYLVRMKPIDKDKNEEVKKALAEKYGKIEELRFETVGPTIGKELSINALKALVFASALIVLYIAWSFRKVPKPASSWRFGVCAIVALLPDVLVVIGIFSFLGHFMHVEVDSLFVTALLTVIGFSVHDTIVVFDRIRENLRKLKKPEPYEEIVNRSVNETIVRSINTSCTVLLVLCAIFFLGGETTRYFSLVLILGIVFGTYSSIFVASPLLVVWHKLSAKRN